MINKEVISLDIFDTAIFRDMYYPTDIFRLISQEFYDLRIKAEDKIRSEQNTYTIEDIYKNIPKEYKIVDEFNMELKHCYANPVILEMYNANPSSYVFISDMYFHTSDLKQLLINCGYINPKVFVSSDLKERKGDGMLFKTVMDKGYKITKHYGDNYLADIVGARKAGIEETCFMQNLVNKKLNIPTVKSSMLQKYLAIVEDTETMTIDKIAKVYTPVIYGFTKWVLEQRKDKNQKIFFVSRDMYMPALISKQILKEDNIYYIYASRKSLSDVDNNKEEILKYFSKFDMKNNDIIVDIGYHGTTQKILEDLLNIKLQGLYMQLSPDKLDVNAKMFLNRPAIIFMLIVEAIFCSPENNLIGYQDGTPKFSQDNKFRQLFSMKVRDIVFDNIDKIKDIDLSVWDIEQILIHYQLYCDEDIMDLYNEPIFTNKKSDERCVNFDRERILNGELFECYDESYAKQLFKRCLQKDKELGYLVELL